MNKAYKLRIYPNNVQQTLIKKTIGCCRAIFNMMLRERMDVYSSLKDDKDKLRKYKYKTEKQYKEEYEWLKEPSAVALQQSRRDLQQAYQNFFNSVTKKNNCKAGFPKFKKKKYGGSFRQYGIQLDRELCKIKVPKVGWVNYRDPRLIEGIVKFGTVSMTPSGKFYISLTVKLDQLDVSRDKEGVLGLDFRMGGGFVDNQGRYFMFPRFLSQAQNSLRFKQKNLSRKQKGSNTFNKKRLEVARLHEKVRNQRMDFLHKISKQLVDEYGIICIESLNMQGMAKRWGKSVSENGWSEFTSMLKYKANWYGSTVVEADKWFPSTKMCSICGEKVDLELSDRSWVCPVCQTYHDRDVNAAVNLKNYGVGCTLNLQEPGKTSHQTGTCVDGRNCLR